MMHASVLYACPVRVGDAEVSEVSAAFMTMCTPRKITCNGTADMMIHCEVVALDRNASFNALQTYGSSEARRLRRACREGLDGGYEPETVSWSEMERGRFVELLAGLGFATFDLELLGHRDVRTTMTHLHVLTVAPWV